MKHLLLIIFIFIFSNLLAQNLTIRSASDTWPPYVDPSIPSGGLSLEVVRASYRSQGYTISHEYMPWARAIKYLKDGSIDIVINMWSSESRKKNFKFSTEYFINKVKFIKRKSDDFIYTDLASLKGKVVGVVRGYDYGDDFHNAKFFKKVEADNLLLNIKKLSSGRVDLTIAEESSAKLLIPKNLIKKLSFSTASYKKHPLHIASGLKNSNHEKYIRAFNEGLKEIKKNGTYQKIISRYTE